MIKKFAILFLLLLPLLLFAQDATGEESNEGLSLGGGVGSVILDGKTYTSIRFMPEVRFGQVGIGLDFDLMIDDEGNAREEDWDELEDYINKVYYIRYAQRGAPFFFKVGGFTDYTISHGLVMRNYTNMLKYPEYRQIGAQVGFRIKSMSDFSVEAFSSNVYNNDILAGRVTLRPLQSVEMPILSKLILGGSFATDRDQYKGITDQEEDDILAKIMEGSDWNGNGIPGAQALLNYGLSQEAVDLLITNGYAEIEEEPTISFDEDDISIWSVDYDLPLIEGDNFNLGHYGEMAQIVDHNMGFIFPGFYAKFLIFNMNLEYRFYQDDFLPGYFDNLYDQDRASVYDDTVRVKESILENAVQTQGWYGSLTSNIRDLIYITAAYEDMYADGKDDDDMKSIWGNIEFNTEMIPKLSTARIAYSQVRVPKIKKLKSPSALIDGKLGYSLSPNTELVARYQERYDDVNGDGKIKGSDETIKTTSISVEFRF